MTIEKVADIVKNKLQSLFNENEIRQITLQLLQHFWQISATDFYINKQKNLNRDFDNDFVQALKLLQNHTPIQYVLGVTEFYGLKFSVDKNVLIPRPETEELVNLIIAENKDAATIIDIGTGSGCIAVALAKNIENAKVYALDISEKAIEKARQNAENNGVCINFFCEDILSANHFTQIKFDCIVSNPPYVRECEKREMKQNVLDFEPHAALFVPDNDALKFYRAIADFAISNLADNGKIYVEINENLGNETQNLFKQKGFAATELHNDLNNKNRILK
ncbi:MAG: peptide chain release factor N(5)-glutamine methyltransferase, partial [Prevotellaceae bacterium]|nr:peptide chain release factor N(5)-glutamine methyltransferase [Prevotellaceae bacterium]